ncbi:MAG: RNA 2'-phosphotransferase [Candidatus Helarchaeota archaeon]
MGYLSYFFCINCHIYLTNKEISFHSKSYPDHLINKVFTDKKRVRLSKLLSLLLRHKPKIFNLKLMKNGYTEIKLDELVEKIKKQPNFEWVSIEKIKAIIELDKKGRFEISDDRIRARYGHSIPWIKIDLEHENVPAFLYHGTTSSAYKKIKIEGIKPMGRNLVHLTSSINDARNIGKRHFRKHEHLILLKIDIYGLKSTGIEVWKAGKNVYVCNHVPPTFISLINQNEIE